MQFLEKSISLESPRYLTTSLQRLLSILHTKNYITAAGYSKVSRGLRFPLEFSGLCTRKIVRGTVRRDSSDLVTPFMQAANQAARHFATLREL